MGSGGVVMVSVINLMSRGLDGALDRQQALADNLANIDTPNYKRKDVDFISVLREESEKSSSLSLKTTNERHIAGSKTEANSFKSLALRESNYRNDKNNVDVDVEMAEVAKNGVYYNTLAKQINDQFRILKDVISKGGSQ
ncbi:flagellar basal body rod protein FlgB [Iocasia frigidifontis]|uniref:Flagellar basal body rod protein FlgB n=2 Tax=Iocasia fonsfrigidae TaxID=2682810 RepID=A0A8A7KGE5_9FIRM|nr:flagellar basal body rod protein FlgB [Iocasia fonsfrigidae]